MFSGSDRKQFDKKTGFDFSQYNLPALKELHGLLKSLNNYYFGIFGFLAEAKSIGYMLKKPIKKLPKEAVFDSKTFEEVVTKNQEMIRILEKEIADKEQRAGN